MTRKGHQPLAWMATGCVPLSANDYAPPVKRAITSTKTTRTATSIMTATKRRATPAYSIGTPCGESGSLRFARQGWRTRTVGGTRVKRLPSERHGGMEVIRENVSPLVQVEVDEVRREGAESDEHPVSGDCGTEAWSIRLVPRQDERGSADRDPRGLARRPVVEKDVLGVVRVAFDQRV